MRRQMLVLGALAFVAALIMAVGSTAQAKMEQYESKVILSLPWGSGPKEIGYAKEGPEDQEGLRYGPTAIDVDTDGNIYIYDMVNSRVKVFDQRGDLLKNFVIKATTSNICVDAHKAVWALDSIVPEVHKYAPDGTFIETIRYEPLHDKGGSFLASKIECIGGKIYVNKFELQPGKAEGKGKKGEIIRKATLKQIGGHRWGITRSGRRYRVEKTSNWSRTFVATDKDGHVSVNVKFRKNHPFEGIHFFSEDKYGNTYLPVTRHMENDQFYQEIWKYTPSNELVAEIGPIFMNFYTDAIIIEKWLVLDGEGNVYQLITEKEGVKIIKWSRK